MGLKIREEIDNMRKGGKILARIFKELEKYIHEGVSTYELSRKVENLIYKYGAKPAFKGYRGYPEVICVSINEEIVHGIPRKNKILKNGDIVSIDIGLEYNGFYVDSARTYPIGEVSPLVLRLIEVTESALWKGIEKARVGNHLSDISWAIQQHVEKSGFSIIRDFTGHGIGKNLHEPPSIPNFGPPGQGPILEEGLALAIEPMVSMGDYRVKILDDGWTAITLDGSLSAHFEHTVIITKNGPEVLTQEE
ncbi:MAG: type I methionyl aminopeptidase [Dictyoglomus sp.]|nr:type I methionyl aminopeptidase [Dictyoglomus sp.]MCX7941841.1 type I methionyl aminopeptidase [Dictyoglomaceae bacterium]MDW8188057.1 type I methionyl aminopeptidase [Dictyoglomus sp.]